MRKKRKKRKKRRKRRKRTRKKRHKRRKKKNNNSKNNEKETRNRKHLDDANCHDSRHDDDTIRKKQRIITFTMFVSVRRSEHRKVTSSSSGKRTVAERVHALDGFSFPVTSHAVAIHGCSEHHLSSASTYKVMSFFNASGSKRIMVVNQTLTTYTETEVACQCACATLHNQCVSFCSEHLPMLVQHG